MEATEKSGRRDLLRAARRERVAQRDRTADDAALAARVTALVADLGLGGGAVVLSYEALVREPPTAGANAALAAGGLEVLLPVTEPDLDLDWRPLAAPEVRLGRDTPGRADLVLAPGLAVDRQGTRIGQGGGSYDRALTRVRPGTPVVVLLHPGEIVEGADLPREPHDVPVDAVLTADGLTDLRTPDRR